MLRLRMILYDSLGACRFCGGKSHHIAFQIGSSFPFILVNDRSELFTHVFNSLYSTKTGNHKKKFYHKLDFCVPTSSANRISASCVTETTRAPFSFHTLHVSSARDPLVTWQYIPKRSHSSARISGE